VILRLKATDGRHTGCRHHSRPTAGRHHNGVARLRLLLLLLLLLDYIGLGGGHVVAGGAWRTGLVLNAGRCRAIELLLKGEEKRDLVK